MGGLSASAVAFLGTSALAGCDDDDKPSTVVPGQETSATSGQMVTLASSAGIALAGTGTQVTVDGSWNQIGGPAVELLDSNGGTASFIAPAVANATELTFRFKGSSLKAAKRATVKVAPAKLSFEAVAKNTDDVVTVPAGYTVTVMTALGDPIAAGVSAYTNDGTDADFAQRIGDHGDALAFFGLGPNGQRSDNYSKRGLLAQNHENITVQHLHPNGPTTLPDGTRPEAEALKEIEAHGVSVTEYRDSGDQAWSYVQDSAFNRRITPNTAMQFHGPASGTEFLRTAYSPEGTRGRGTINNCANGVARWATLLTCEENWAGYFRRNDDEARNPRELIALRRYGVSDDTGNYGWASIASSDTIFRRWDANAVPDRSAVDDFRNEPNQLGWVVEIDPYNPASTPRKRTALGRMGHEGAWVGKLSAGKPVAVYMGDDSRREYFYKFVSDAAWSPNDAQAEDRLGMGDKYLDAGTLYVAKFNADGTRTWLPLVLGKVPSRPAVESEPEYEFQSQADILVNARLAADAVEATPMDRPEWTATNPVTGEIYLTLTNSNASKRPLSDTNAANPRHYSDPKDCRENFGNPNGHIVRIHENGDDPAATTFAWDIYLFGADSAEADPQNVNLSGVHASNDFSSPDGLWFSRSGNPAGQVNPLLWIQTDDSALGDRTNDQMLAALPGVVGDGGAVTITNTGADGSTATQLTQVGAPATTARLKRFLVGPTGCEITGVDTTPDGRTLFVGIQHPGANWPQSQSGNANGRPRSAVVAITRGDGGGVGL